MVNGARPRMLSGITFESEANRLRTIFYSHRRFGFPNQKAVWRLDGY
jgi:hypothetical protein